MSAKVGVVGRGHGTYATLPGWVPPAEGGGLGSYALAIHCGGCMIDQQKIRARILDLQVRGGLLCCCAVHAPHAVLTRVHERGSECQGLTAACTPAPLNHQLLPPRPTSRPAGGGRPRHQLRPAAVVRTLAGSRGARAQALGPRPLIHWGKTALHLGHYMHDT